MSYATRFINILDYQYFRFLYELLRNRGSLVQNHNQSLSYHFATFLFALKKSKRRSSSLTGLSNDTITTMFYHFFTNFLCWPIVHH